MSSQSPTSNSIESVLQHVTVVIPALNEEASLPLVLDALPRVRQIIVVDNGCVDRTSDVARRGGAVVVEEPRRGYGSACLAGLQFLREQIKSGAVPAGLVAFVDADFSDHPDRLAELVRPIADQEADFVLGSRLLGEREPGAMLPQALFGNRLACFLMRLFFGARYTDLGPFRVIRWESLELMEMADRDFGWTIEMQIKAAKLGVRTVELPVPYRRRVGTSKISGTISGTIRAGYKILYTIFKYAWRTRAMKRDERSSQIVKAV